MALCDELTGDELTGSHNDQISHSLASSQLGLNNQFNSLSDAVRSAFSDGAFTFWDSFSSVSSNRTELAERGSRLYECQI